MFISWIKGDYRGGIATPFICLMAMITISFIYFIDDYYHKQDILKVSTDAYLCDILMQYGEEESENVAKGEIVTLAYTVGEVVIDKRSEYSFYSISCYLKSGFEQKKTQRYET